MVIGRRRALSAAAVVSLVALPSFALIDPTGIIDGPNEHPVIQDLMECKEEEETALALVDPYFVDNQKLPDQIALAAQGNLQESVGCLSAVGLDILDRGPYQPTTAPDLALKSLAKAQKADGAAIDAIKKKKTAGLIYPQILKAITAKRHAIQALSGMPTSDKDKPALDANPPLPTIAFEPDLKAGKNLGTPTPAAIAAGTGDADNATCKAKSEPKPANPYKSARSGIHGKAAKVVPNVYYAYEGKSASTGYVFNSLGRDLFGPFEVKFQVGAFDPDATVDTGSACVEFDVKGSDPLQFFAVCGRRVNGGVQVFAQSENGSAGSLFIASTRIAQVRVQYSGTQFTCSAGSGKDAPDFVLANFATYNLTQGATALVAGIGASGLTKGAEIGLDEIYVTPK